MNLPFPIRSLFVTTLSASLLLIARGGAQEKTEAWMLHPFLSLAISGLHASYEHGIGDGRWALEIPLYLGYSERVYDNATLFLGSGFGMRRYLSDAGKGTFVSPEIEIVNVHQFASGPEEPGNLVVASPSLRMGYKWRWKVATLEMGLGTALLLNFVTAGNVDSQDEYVGLLVPMGHFAVGIPF